MALCGRDAACSAILNHVSAMASWRALLQGWGGGPRRIGFHSIYVSSFFG